jgi:hypothetical protein
MGSFKTEYCLSVPFRNMATILVVPRDDSTCKYQILRHDEKCCGHMSHYALKFLWSPSNQQAETAEKKNTESEKSDKKDK